MATRVSNSSPSWAALVNEAHAWQIRPHEFDSRTLRERCFGWLSSDERARYDQFATEKLRHDYLTARVLCRSALSRYANVHPSEWKFEKNTRGKPRIAAPAGLRSLRFNLTHTEGLAICVISRAGEVGIDAEETACQVDAALIARHFFSRHEQAQFEKVPENERLSWFFTQWVVKEAYLKGTGRGLDEPERVTVRRDGEGRPLAIGSWHFSLCRPTPHHMAACAVQRGRAAAPVTVQWLENREFFASPSLVR